MMLFQQLKMDLSHLKKLKRDITVDDIKKLTEIPIRKISKFDLDKVKEKLANIELT